MLKREEVYKWFVQDCTLRESIIARIIFVKYAKRLILFSQNFFNFFDSQNNVIMKSDFLKFCFTCSSQNLILAKSKKICDFSFAKSLNFFAAKIHSHNPTNSLLWITPSLTPVFPLPLSFTISHSTDYSKQTARRFTYFRFFCCDFFPKCT